MAAVSKHTLASAIRERFGFNYFVIPLCSEIAVNFLGLAVQIGGVCIALQLVTGISFQWFALPVAMLIWLVLWLGKLGMITNSVSLLGLITLTFVFATFKLHPELTQIGSGLLPTLPRSNTAHYLYIAVGILGASIGPHLFYFYSSAAVEDQWDEKNIGANRAIASLGMGFGSMVSVGVLIVAARNLAMESRLSKLTESEKAEIFAEYPQSAAVLEMDEQSFLQWCKAAGLSDDAIKMMLAARGLVGDTVDFSALSIIRIEENLKNDLDEIVGGTDRLPAAIAHLLKSKPRMGCEVIRIERDDEGQKAAAIYTKNGRTKREEGDFVLCTIPFPVLSRLDTPFSGTKQQAIRGLSYNSAMKVQAVANRRFWESDDGIYGGGTYSDLPIGTTYYPNDNASAKNPEVSAGPGVILASYTWGSQARHLGKLPPEERHALIQQYLGLIHPQINQEGVLRRMESWYWDNHPWSLAGFAFMKPYQQTGLYKDVVAPEGRIYFAGEHTSTQYAWIEGAVESSVRAVKEMLVAA